MWQTYSAQVEAEHTYRARAVQALAEFESLGERRRIGIKIGAPSREMTAASGATITSPGAWAASLRKLGYRVRIDCMDEWYSELALGDDAVIVLRGLDEYEPRPGQVNLMWLISHPDLVNTAELLSYDHVFVASESFTRSAVCRRAPHRQPDAAVH